MLVDDLKAFAPDVLVVSGDLTQRARQRELQAARAFLDALRDALRDDARTDDATVFALRRTE